MAFAEDFAVYTADLGTAAVLDGRAVRVVFDNAYAEFGGVASRMPQAGLATADAGAAAQGSTLVLGASTYRVRSVEPDGTGWTTLMLELQP